MGEEKKWKKSSSSSSSSTEAKAELKRRSAIVAFHQSKGASSGRSILDWNSSREEKKQAPTIKDRRTEGQKEAGGLLYSASGSRYDMLNRDRERTLGCKGATHQKLETAWKRSIKRENIQQKSDRRQQIFLVVRKRAG